MRTELEKHLGDDRFAKHTGILLLKVEPDYALARMDVQDFHMNGVNRVHGGAIVTLADYAFAAASFLLQQVEKPKTLKHPSSRS